MNKLPDCGMCGLDIKYHEFYHAINEAFRCMGCGLDFHFNCVHEKPNTWANPPPLYQCRGCVEGEL